jgi:NAD(P)-dependent dehydrogenase (short-subunit alcohol dehydrogenase family)
VAVVTGGASGIGRATALELARRGADVVIADLHVERMEATVAELEGLGRRALGVRCDVTSDEEVDALAAESLRAMGRVDLVMNNAGVALLGPPESIPVSDWEWILQVNLLGIVRGVRAFTPHMLERGSGHVVNTASIAGLYAYGWDSPAYIASKFAAYGLSESLALYLRPQGIGVTVVCPGLVETNLGEQARFSGLDDPSVWTSMAMHLRPITAEEVATQVVDAVEAERFLVVTHPEDVDLLRRRHADIEAALAAQIEASPPPPSLH